MPKSSLTILIALFCLTMNAQNVAQWRGPNRDGVYNEKGVLIEETTYDKNLKSGLWVTYYSNGNPEVKGYYKNGEYKDGEWQYFDEDGNLTKTETYKAPSTIKK